jgi:alanine racemase
MKFRSQLIINLHFLKENFQYLNKIAANCQTLFMVKADGYGHGMLSIVRYAYEELGIREFGCATINEAQNLRRDLRDLNFDIYVFSDVQLDNPESVEIYSNERIFPVITGLDQLNFFLHQESFKYFPLCLKFNTGMNRLGLELQDLSSIIQLLSLHKRKSIYHLFTHLANSSLPMTTVQYNIDQQSKFKIVQDQFKLALVDIERTSISNSGAILQSSGLEQTHIRPGLTLYTYPQCISRLETKILKVFEVQKDTPIGYNSVPCVRDGVVAVLAIGYGDGFSTRYSGAHITHLGFKGEIIGRVNMDMTFVLFPPSSKDKIRVGDIVTVWGEKEGDLLNFSEETKTIPYELLCSLLPRIPRIYRLE